jgi:hypothetical protein
LLLKANLNEYKDANERVSNEIKLKNEQNLKLNDDVSLMNLKINELKTSIENVIFIFSCINFNLIKIFLKKNQVEQKKKRKRRNFFVRNRYFE